MSKILSVNKFWVLVPLFAGLYSRKSGWAIMARSRLITSYQSLSDIGLKSAITQPIKKPSFEVYQPFLGQLPQKLEVSKKYMFY